MADQYVKPYALTVEGAVRHTGLSRTRVYNLIKEGGLASFTIGSRRMFLTDILDAFMDKQASEANASIEDLPRSRRVAANKSKAA